MAFICFFQFYIFLAENWRPPETQRLSELLRALIFLCMLSVPGCVIPAFLHIILTPCFPGLFAYFLFTPCFDKNEEWKLVPHGIMHALIIPFMFTFVLHLVPPLLLEAIIYTSLHCLCLANYHYLFWKDVQKYQNGPRAVQMYNELKLLTTYYNQIHGNILSITIAFFLSTNFIAAAYAIIGLYSEIHLIQFLYFAFFTIDCFLGILVGDGGYKANVNKVSDEILRRIKAARYFRMKRLMRRYFYSWSSAKIKLGGSNFYDKETPLILINFCFCQIVNLLLI